MARLPIVIYPNDVLIRRAADVTKVDGKLVEFIHNMRETMYAANGIGLAAPQVDSSTRIITVDVEPHLGGSSFMHLINPVIVDSYGRTTYEEGCLSFPGLGVEVRRKKQVHVQAYDYNGKLIDLEADGLLAICLQHEIDHINGITFIDRLSPVQKRIVVRDYMRRREEEEEDQKFEEILRMHGVKNESEAAEAGEAVLVKNK